MPRRYIAEEVWKKVWMKASTFLVGFTFGKTKLKVNLLKHNMYMDISELLERYRAGERDFRDASLYGANLNDVDLSGTNLWRAKLIDATLNGVNLNQSNLSRAYLHGAKLNSTNLGSADLSDANLANTIFSRTYLGSADLSGADLSGANLSGCVLSGADLRGADLTNTDLSGAFLDRTQVSYSNLTGANLKSAFLKESNLKGAILIDADLSDANLTETNLIEANLCRANLQFAKLNCSNLAYGKLSKADLRATDLTSANLARTDLTDAKLDGAKLEGTILERIKINQEAIGTNHCTKFSSEQRIIYWNNLRFRSNAEVKIAEALDRAGVLYFPNSMARLNTPEGRKNKEPDFLICCETSKGFRWGILETDGPHHTPQRRVEEQERERIFEHSGVRVYRFDSKKCENQPDKIVREFLELLNKY